MASTTPDNPEPANARTPRFYGIAAAATGSFVCGLSGMLVAGLSLWLTGLIDYFGPDKIGEIALIGLGVIGVPLALAGLVIFGLPGYLIGQRRRDKAEGILTEAGESQRKRVGMVGCAYGLVGFLLAVWFTGLFAFVTMLGLAAAPFQLERDLTPVLINLCIVTTPVGLIAAVLFGAIGALLGVILRKPRTPPAESTQG